MASDWRLTTGRCPSLGRTEGPCSVRHAHDGDLETPGKPGHHLEDGRVRVHVLVGVEVRQADSFRPEAIDLGRELPFDFAQRHASRQAADDERPPRAGEASIAVDQRGHESGRQCRNAIDKGQVHTDAERRPGPQPADRICRRGRIGHQTGARQHALLVRIEDAGVDAGRQAEIVRVDDEGAHDGQLLGTWKICAATASPARNLTPRRGRAPQVPDHVPVFESGVLALDHDERPVRLGCDAASGERADEDVASRRPLQVIGDDVRRVADDGRARPRGPGDLPDGLSHAVVVRLLGERGACRCDALAYGISEQRVQRSRRCRCEKRSHDGERDRGHGDRDSRLRREPALSEQPPDAGDDSYRGQDVGDGEHRQGVAEELCRHQRVADEEQDAPELQQEESALAVTAHRLDDPDGHGAEHRERNLRREHARIERHRDAACREPHGILVDVAGKGIAVVFDRRAAHVPEAVAPRLRIEHDEIRDHERGEHGAVVPQLVWTVLTRPRIRDDVIERVHAEVLRKYFDASISPKAAPLAVYHGREARGSWAPTRLPRS